MARSKIATNEGAKPRRGRCPECQFSYRLRSDGTLTRHPVYLGSEPRLCEGSHRPAATV